MHSIAGLLRVVMSTCLWLFHLLFQVESNFLLFYKFNTSHIAKPLVKGVPT